MKETEVKGRYAFMNGGGEMGSLTRAHDWSSTPLGSPDTWSPALKATVGIILHSDFPMFLWWGEEMIQFYNDAYRPSLGENGKHPKALGQNAVECWPEIWDIIYPLIEQVKTTGKSFFSEDQLIPIFRNGKIEDVNWTFSYSAVIGESGNTDGVLVVCNETTRKVKTLAELQSTRDQLAQSESNLRSIILQAPAAMAILKGSRHVVEIANDRMLELWGLPGEAVLGKPIFDVLTDARSEGFESLCSHVFSTGETIRGDAAPVTLPRKHGPEQIFVNFVYEALHERDGRISGIMVLAVDVTQQELSRKKLQESEDRVRAIIESAPFPIGVYTGREMKIELVNQSIKDVWGKGNDVVGKTYSEVLPELADQSIFAQVDRVLETGVPFHARQQRVDIVMEGKLQSFYFNYSFTPLYDSSGKIYGVMNTAAEVTDLIVAKQQVEQSELNFRNMVKQAPVAMCILMGPEHIIEVANDLMIELWGMSRVDVIGKPVFVALPEAAGQGLEQLLGDVYQTGMPFSAIERPVTLRRGGKPENVYQNFVYEPYRDADGTILGVLAITLDVTPQVVARRQIEEVVKERTDSLRKSNAELSQFAYITSHDLQEPARKISTFIEMLENSLGDRIDVKSRGYLDKIDSASNRMLTLIRDILAISQLSKINVEFEQVDLNSTLTEVMDDFELLIEQSGSEIKSDVLPVVRAIPVQMNQLFSNMISNALKFRQVDRSPELHITATLLEPHEVTAFPNLKPAPKYYRLNFRDNGIGFKQSNAEQIFDIFQRLHSKNEYQGTGIGLAMCKKIAENHGGHIFAISNPGEGATFTLILPTNGG